MTLVSGYISPKRKLAVIFRIFINNWFCKKFIQRSPFKEDLTDDIREYVKILFDMIHFQGNNKQQVITDGNPYLCEDCILGRPVERLNVQMLLDPFEERFDSPTLSIQFCNGNCFKREVIRQESIYNVLRKVLIDDQAQQIRILLGRKETCKADGLVRDDTSLLVNLPCLEYGILHITSVS